MPNLYRLDNLVLYLSTDEYNVEIAHEIASQYPGIRLALCAEDYRSARELARDTRTLVCPENVGKIALMENGRGACVSCRWCPDGKFDVIFSTSHLDDANPQLPLFIEQTPVSFIKRPADASN